MFADSRPSAVPELLRNFSGANPGIAFTSDMTVEECFEKFIADDVVSYLCRCVNDRASKYFTDNPDKKGFVNKLKWKDVSNGDMYVFLALYLFSGICKFSEMNEYWAKQPLEPGIHFYTPAVMSRDRYFSIMKFLRFSAVNEVDENDPSARLKTFCDMLTDISMKNVDAGEHVAIDEALVLWKGRLHFWQFIRTKRARFGIKLFVMCNSEKDWNGYNWSFCVYYGKDRYIFPQSLDVSELSKSETNSCLFSSISFRTRTSYYS